MKKKGWNKIIENVKFQWIALIGLIIFIFCICFSILIMPIQFRGGAYTRILQCQEQLHRYSVSTDSLIIQSIGEIESRINEINSKVETHEHTPYRGPVIFPWRNSI